MGTILQPNITLNSLCKALANGEFFYFYQPIVSLESGKICGAEALLRWKQSDGSIVMPASFIPLAENTGFLTEMNQELLPILMDGLTQINVFAPSMFVHFNLSTADLLVNGLANVIHKHALHKNINAGAFRVEIVESVFMPPVPRVEETIAELVLKGIPVVLNDFSAGYTTLNFLSKLPLVAIKLAMNIVQRATTSRKDFRILRHLVSMGYQLGLDIIAEGIETEEMYDLTLSTGSMFAQGYYFSYPLSLADYLTLLQKQPHWPSYPFGMEYLTQIGLIDFRRDIIRAALTINKYEQEEIRKRALARLPELDYSKSNLGLWYSGIGREWNGMPEFKQLGDTHQRMYETAKHLIQAALNNESMGTIIQFVNLLSEQSSQIMHYLQEIETNGLLKHYKQ